MRRETAHWPRAAAIVLGLAMTAGCKKDSPTAPDQPQTETVTLEFSSDIRGTADVGAAAHAYVHSHFSLALDTSLPHDQTTRSYRGSGQLEWITFSLDNPNPEECSDPTFSKQVSVLTANIGLSSVYPGGPPAMLVNMNPGHPLENVSLTCRGVTATLFTVPPGFWETSFRALHASEVSVKDQALSIIMGVASPSGSGFVAVKPYNRTVPASHGTLSEATTLMITVGR